jgi:hypothetical protein
MNRTILIPLTLGCLAISTSLLCFGVIVPQLIPIIITTLAAFLAAILLTMTIEYFLYRNRAIPTMEAFARVQGENELRNWADSAVKNPETAQRIMGDTASDQNAGDRAKAGAIMLITQCGKLVQACSDNPDHAQQQEPFDHLSMAIYNTSISAAEQDAFKLLTQSESIMFLWIFTLWFIDQLIQLIHLSNERIEPRFGTIRPQLRLPNMASILAHQARQEEIVGEEPENTQSYHT